MPTRWSVCVAASALAAVPAGFAQQCPGERIHSPMRWHFGTFGRSVQIAGEVAVVADSTDPTHCPGTSCNSGAVHVFRQASGGWSLDATIYHSRISDRDGFGGDIAMDGPDRFAAAAAGEDIAGTDTGAVYIFEHNGEAWREVAEILPVEPVWNRGFGNALALQGDTLVIGQMHDACWVYRLRNGSWEFDQKIPTPDPSAPTWFAESLALDEDWLAVGAPQDGTFGHKGGVVYLYRRSGGGSFESAGILTAPDPAAVATFGSAVDIDDDRMVVGAPVLDDRIGAAFVYELTAGSWALMQELRGDLVRSDFGASVAMHGSAIVIGGPLQSGPGSSGAAYTFRRQPDGAWLRTTRFVPEEPTAFFGWSIATDGVRVIVGAPDETVGGAPQTGAAHIFDLPCLLCRVDLDGDTALTFFDFLAFQNLFAAGDPRADFDGDGELTFFDFLAFQNEFAAGCA